MIKNCIQSLFNSSGKSSILKTVIKMELFVLAKYKVFIKKFDQNS
ncbi:hypothetical protein SD77_1766 [Bacillus badius]|uniref:Mobile element protein n=1 Tax=Bacillus badius TaxID=1455 RepID=A0ABR5AS30_BACBA|nr:hypothetical protein SD78_4246 [Bacillus badius]KIL77161.1 hypothetical protein SD77_1766 [Bacillus badius]